MLDFYFVSEVRRRQLHRGPLAGHIDGLAAELQRHAFAKHTARRILSVVGQFSHFAGLVGVAAEDVSEDLVDRFLTTESVDEGLFQSGRSALRHMMGYLRMHGIIGSPPPPTAQPFASTLERFDGYLQNTRGLAAATRAAYLTSARALVDWLCARYRDQALARLAGSDVLEFITDRLDRFRSPSTRAHLCSLLRGFLRYLYGAGIISADLARAVPKIASPRLASLPRGLPWDQVRALIDGVDTSHPDGMRDKAILLLLATLGLRSCEVRSLELRNITWRAGEIRLPHTKTRRERILPLLPEVGAALADYVLHGRPALAVPQVFLRHGPRPATLATPNTVIWIVRRHLLRAGIRVPRSGVRAHDLCQ